ncbi:MAG: SufD family Fe-S cluster assembly protein, partial [Candidatus Micrarchaeota archaeon]|nr:SufD family Fe-S cluster assembly protein [Candidatus Micrarchaeota archaeon]
LQENGAKAATVSGMTARLGEASTLKFLNSNIGSSEKREGFAFLQEGRGSRCEHYEASLARGSQKITKNSDHFHLAPDTYSRSIFKYATTDKSQVNVDGKVTIEKSAPGADTHLLAKSLLLSDSSISKIVPQLFVHNADVAAGHGSAMTPMPEEELFYLQSRGVGESESKLLVLQGFLQDVLVKSEINQAALSEFAAALERDAMRVFPRD